MTMAGWNTRRRCSIFKKSKTASGYFCSNLAESVADFLETKGESGVKSPFDFSLICLKNDQLITFVCDYFNITKDQLCVSRRGKEDLPRDLAIFLIWQHARITLAVIGEYFGVAKYSTVSSTIEPIKTRSEEELIARENIDKIKKKLNKGQGETLIDSKSLFFQTL